MPSSHPVGSSTSGNPLFPGWYADPEIHFFRGRYYIYPTSPEPYGENPCFECWSSGDLTDWKNEGVILRLAEVRWSTNYAACTFSTGGYISAEVSNRSGSVDPKNQSFGFSGGSLITTLVIPANTLTAGCSYNGHINFGLASDFKTSRATDLAIYTVETTFDVQAEPSTYNFVLEVNIPQGSTYVPSQWLGYEDVAQYPFIYDPYLGYIYPYGTEASSVFFYDFMLNDFIFTSEYDYPFFYGYKHPHWYYMYVGTQPANPGLTYVYEFGGRGLIQLNQY